MPTITLGIESCNSPTPSVNDTMKSLISKTPELFSVEKTSSLRIIEIELLSSEALIDEIIGIIPSTLISVLYPRLPMFPG